MIPKEAFSRSLVLSREGRVFFSKPLGVLLSFFELREVLTEPAVFVGDVVSSKAYLQGLRAKAFVFDGRVQRSPRQLPLPKPDLEAENPPGTISALAVRALATAISKGLALRIKGEEDLLALPAVVLSQGPVVYGQPGKGVVLLRPSDVSKDFLSYFHPSEREPLP